MRAVVQRVEETRLEVDEKVISKINGGLLVYIAVEDDDTEADLDYIFKKVTNLRIFSDEDDKMNLSVQDICGEILLVSQFTLYGDARKGNRPNFMKSAKAEKAESYYEIFKEKLKMSGIKYQSGVFGADMHIHAHLSGPVTILLDSKKEF